MRSDWSHCTFYRAQNISARILAVFRRSSSIKPEYLDWLVGLLRELGPECEQICREALSAPVIDSHELEQLDARLRTQLELAEDKLPAELDELERFLFQPVCHEQVLAEELDEIAMLRSNRRCGPMPSGNADVHDRARQANLCGLALSGGGIRSATFNLGLLQGMAKHGVLPMIDYLSMVSGGGYIGGWLTAWIKRDGFGHVEKALADEESSPRGEGMLPLAFLRDYSSYLTPQTGLFSADTWTAFMTWMRNTLLNLVVLLSGLSALLLMPRLLKSSQIGLQGWLYWLSDSHYPEESLTLVAVLCQAVIIVHAGLNLKAFKSICKKADSTEATPGFGYSAKQVQNWIIVPALFAAALGSARLWGLAVELGSEADKDIDSQGLFVHLLGLSVMVVACFVLLGYLQWRGGFVECYSREKRRSKSQMRVAGFLCVLLPALVAVLKSALLYGVFLFFTYVYRAYPNSRDAIAITCGTPILLTVFAACLSIHMGLMGRNFPDDRREWWSRIAAYLGIYAAGISSVFAVAFFGRKVVETLSTVHWGGVSVVVSWASTTAAGLFLAQRKGREKGTQNERKSAIALNMFIAFSPVVFVAGLFIGLSAALDTLLAATQDSLNAFPALARLSGINESSVVHPFVVLFYLVFLLAVMFGFAKTVDINEFSMHHFYRNRLIRAYLGASNCKKRNPNRLTGFDQTDDLAMASLRPECEPGLRNYGYPYEGPYPLFNAALNLVHGDRLSWQERKATSFVFTPKFCGYDYQPIGTLRSVLPLRDAGYRPTSVYAYPDGGIHLGTAMAISGAALSPNSGVHTSTSMAFLLTVFNVRLGWWLGNPRNDKGWQCSGPRFGLVYLIYELFGWTNDRQKQVYLSDGGHFDNLGIYELVRRRCSLIIASDAEEDADCSFHGLGGVIRKCFVDFGVQIDLDLERIRPQSDGFSREHFAVGRVHYPEGWSGTLLYVKSSLTGDEPADLREYMAGQQTFPNQSTADQSFDESQFESYHRLGLHVAKGAFGPGNPADMPAIAKKIRDRNWTELEPNSAPSFWTENTRAAAGD